jgi:hypothetical protein
MFVPCPHCGFLVALIVSNRGAAQLCPRCGQRLDEDVDGAASASPGGGADTSQAAAAIVTGPVAAPSAATPPPAPAEPEVPAIPVAASTSTPAPRRRRHRAPSFVRVAPPVPSTRGPRWPGRLAVLGLAALLGVQLLLAQRQALAGSERWRPLLAGTCTVLGCELPPWHQPSAYTMLARSVQPATRPGVLAVTASFRNDARWPQPWPALSLSLSDVRGQTVAQRTFTPAEYAGADAAATAALAPGQSASVQFDVVEPGSPIVAFTFEFR